MTGFGRQALLAAMLLAIVSAAGCDAGPRDEQRSITDRSLEWPTADQWLRVLSLRDYNTRVVVSGTAVLGLAAGLIGSFTLLRRRALMGDALSHATLPGIGMAFMLVTAMGGEGKSLAVLLPAATISGVAGVGAILVIRNTTKIKEDAALGIVLSVFFGAGIALLVVAQRTPKGNAAGLESFIYGKTASMVASDAWLILAAAVLCGLVSLLLFKELKLLCFDEGYAASRGFPVVGLDIVLMTLVTLVTVIGLQAVGLILMIALLVIPAAAARFWSQQMTRMAMISSAIGAVSAMLGAGMSALFPRLPSGAMIVLVSASFFLVSMIAGPDRGVLIRWLRRKRLNANVDRQHLLRGAYELLEARGVESYLPHHPAGAVSFDQLLAMRSWSAGRLRTQLRRTKRAGLVQSEPDGGVRLTAQGFREAARLVHEHRLWEMYLIRYADIAPSKVDRDADAIEHVLDPELIAELESLLELRPSVATSPHPIVHDGKRPPKRGAR